MSEEEVLEKLEYEVIEEPIHEYIEGLSKIILESKNPKEIIDKCNKTPGNKNLSYLNSEVYKLPIPGYKDLYDYLCTLSYLDRIYVPDEYKKTENYLFITIKRKGLTYLVLNLNTDNLYKIYPESKIIKKLYR